MVWLRRIAVALATFYIAVVAALWLGQSFFIYPAPQSQSALPDGFTEITVTTADGIALRSFYREAKEGLPTLVYFHGNGGTLTGSATATQPLAEQGIGLLLAEYRGYAGHAGEPTEEGLYRDGDAAMAWLEGRGISAQSTIIMGNSLGTGVATEMALRHRPVALILSAPFTSLPDAASANLPWVPVHWLMSDRYASEKKLPQLDMPILIQHGTVDHLVPFEQGLALSKTNSKAEFQRFEGAGHGLAFERASGEARARWIAELKQGSNL